jgi:hypothetical protein
LAALGHGAQASSSKPAIAFAVIREVTGSHSKAAGYVIDPAEKTAPPLGVWKNVR